MGRSALGQLTKLFTVALPEGARARIASRVATLRFFMAVGGLGFGVLAVWTTRSTELAFATLLALGTLLDSIVQHRRGPRPVRIILIDSTMVLFLITFMGLAKPVAGITYSIYVIMAFVLMGPVARWLTVAIVSTVFGGLSEMGLPWQAPIDGAFLDAMNVGLSFSLILSAMSLVQGIWEAFGDQLSVLNDANQRLEAEASARDRLISSLGHELRTPLTGVIGLAHELNHQWDDFDEGVRRELAVIIAQQSSMAGEIAENLLVAGRANVNMLSIRIETVSLSDLAIEAVRAVDWLRGSDTAVSVTGDAVVDVDRQRAVKAIKNLVINAYEHGGPNVAVETLGDGSITVIDDGPEIEQAKIDAMFLAYTGTGFTTQPGSVGVGLSVSDTLARLMGGRLGYRRTARGTEFCLTLPTRSDSVLPLQQAEH